MLNLDCRLLRRDLNRVLFGLLRGLLRNLHLFSDRHWRILGRSLRVWCRGYFEASSLVEDQSFLRPLGRVMLITIIIPKKHTIDSLQVLSLLRRNRDISLHRVNYRLQVLRLAIWLLDYL